MEGLYYYFDTIEHPVIHLLRFYPEPEYVIAKVIPGNSIEDVNKELKQFAVNGLKLIGDPALIYMGAYSECANRLNFKIENEAEYPLSSYIPYDLLTFKGIIISDNELQLSVNSKRTKTTFNRTY